MHDAGFDYKMQCTQTNKKFELSTCANTALDKNYNSWLCFRSAHSHNYPPSPKTSPYNSAECECHQDGLSLSIPTQHIINFW